MNTKAIILTLSMFLLVGISVQAQKKEKAKASGKKEKISYFAKIGDKYFEKEEYFLAAESYNKAIRSDANDVYASFKLAESYRSYFDYNKAESAYGKVTTMQGGERFPVANFWYAMMLKTNGKYEKAKEQFEIFMENFQPSNEDEEFIKSQAMLEYQGTRLALYEMKRAMRDYKLKVLPKPINTPASEFAPVIYRNDSSIVITSARQVGNTTDPRFGTGFSNFYRFEKQGIMWEELKEKDDFDNINTQLNDGAGVFNSTQTKFYYTSCYSTDVCEIMVSELVEGKWQKPVKLNENINMPGYPSKQPNLSISGDTIFFVSNRPGGKGQNDIWYSTKSGEGDDWGSAVNLESVNTPYTDMSPCFYLDEGQKVLFFASNGRESFGGLDIFMAKEDNFSYVVNSGLPFNSNRDDFYFVIGKEYGYLSSNREGGYGNDDIYMFSVKSRGTLIATISADSITGYESISVAGKLVTDDAEGPAKDVTMALSDEDDVEIKTTKTNEQGEFRFDNLSTDKSYKLGVDEEGGVSTKSKYLVDDVKVYGSESKASKTLFENIYFDFDKADLRPEARKVLDDLVSYLQKNPNVQIEMNASTDAIGGDAYNKALSKRRGEAALSYLKQAGVDNTKIVINSLGKSQPLASNSNVTGRQLNRRVEFYILGGPSFEAKAMAYVVQPGNTLKEIASKFNMTEEELRELNDLNAGSLEAFRPLRVRRLDANTVVAPTTLAVAGESSGAVTTNGRNASIDPSSLKPGEAIYQVQNGNTLFSIARMHQMTVNELMEMNGITDNRISVGQMLKVRSKDFNNNLDQSMYYVVKEGDTMYSIAKKFGLTTDELKELNNLDNYKLFESMVLKIKKAGFSE